MLISILFAGCCLYATHAPPGYSVQLKDNDLLGFYAIRLRPSESGWRLSGHCYQGGHYQWASRTYRVVVEVKVEDGLGHLIERHYVSTFPEQLHHRYKDSGLGDFMVVFNRPLPPGSMLSVEAKSFSN